MTIRNNVKRDTYTVRGVLRANRSDLRWTEFRLYDQRTGFLVARGNFDQHVDPGDTVEVPSFTLRFVAS